MAGQKLVNADTLAATFTTGVISIPQESKREVTLAVAITNGAGAAPTSAPNGAWTGEWSWDGTTWFLLDDTDVITQLTKLNATGNNLIKRSAKLIGVPGALARFTFTRASGGGAGAACDLWSEAV